MKLSRPAAFQCQANSVCSQEHRTPWSTWDRVGKHGCAHMAQDDLVMMSDGGCEYLNWFFNSGLKKRGMDNSVFWHAEWIFVLCLNSGKNHSWAKDELWPGQCRMWQNPLPCFISGEGSAIKHSPAKGFNVDITSIFQRKQILPENFQ